MARPPQALALGLAALLVAGGGLLGHPGDHEVDRHDEPTTELHGDHEGAAESRRVILMRRHEGAPDVQVEILSQVHSGRIAWRLLDPRGKELVDLTADGGKLRGGSGRVECGARSCRGDFRLEMEVRGDATWTLRTWGLVIVPGPGARSQDQ